MEIVTSDAGPWVKVVIRYRKYEGTVDGSEILRSPVEVGSLSHYL